MKEYRFTISECSPVHATVQYRNAELSVNLTEEIDFAEPFETLACLLRLKHINTGILLHLQDALGAEQRKSKLPASNAHYQYAIGLVSKTAHGVYDNFLL